MFFSPAVGAKELAHFCRRLATSFEAGIDARTTWTREASGRASPAMLREVGKIHDAVERGATMTDALKETGSYFPVLFREMFTVGERTGKLPEVLRQLAEHYEHQLVVRRQFLSAIAWPMLQLGAAIVVIGFLIWILGMIGQMTGTTTDIIGFGLVGNQGLLIYVLVIGSAAAAVALLVRGIQRGLAWTRPAQLVLLQLPGLGGPLKTMALARFTWALHLTTSAGLDLFRSLKLAIRTTHNVHFTDHVDTVLQEIRQGREVSEALNQTRAFPRDLLDAIEVGERSGRLPETMKILSAQYQDQAQRAMSTIAMFAGFAVWGMVAVMIIFMIFRLASFYLGTITDLSKPM